MKKKLILYSFYHSSNAVGSLRSKAFVKFFGEDYHIDIRCDDDIKEYRRNTIKKEKRRHYLKTISTAIRSIDSSIFSDYFLSETRRIFKEKSDDFQIIYVTYKPAAGIYLGLIRKIFKGGYLVIEYRDLMSLFGRKPRFILLHHLDVLIEKLVLGFVDLLVVVSETQKVKLQSLTSKKILVITNGVDNFETRDESGTQPALLYAGSLSKERDLERILSWLDGTAVKIFIASKSIPHDLLEHQRVEYLGWLNEERLRKYCLKVNGFILLEGLGSESNENIPAKLFYYLSFQKIIFADISDESDIWKLPRIKRILYDYKKVANVELLLEQPRIELNELGRERVFKPLKLVLGGI